jgi:arylsulfatase
MTEVEFSKGEKRRRATSLAEGMRGFAAQVDGMDQNVGKVVAKLKELGQFDNTLILFCSDNGATGASGWKGSSVGMIWGQVSNMPFKNYKASSYDGGAATPLIMHWPKRISGAARGSINRSVGHLVDIMPTVLAAAGATYPDKDLSGRDLPKSSGRSLLPVLDGKHVPLNEPVFVEHYGNCALIDEDWKLLANDGRAVGPWALYNMRTDRCEMTNVAAEHPEVVKRMDAQWHAIAKRINARRQGPFVPKAEKAKWGNWKK